MRKILIFVTVIFSYYGHAATSLSDIITLNANIVNMDDINSADIKSTIVGDNYKTLVYDNSVSTFRPITFQLRSTTTQVINQYSFNVLYKNMTCSQNNSVISVPLYLSINNINEQDNKITLLGRGFWYKVTTGEANSPYNQYISDVYFKVNFGNITNSSTSDLPCYGNVILLTSIDL
ncbi:hypothetical protein [Photobacterium kishitanii]|uniref:Uncharacterized protein n=1 Tax=Photobacterium kishitanii TaxID=318456 RepID=A0A0B7JET4_9GAMM|nr:hypothetical protein [Photobacterium kishitanii]PSU92057.1 hypothetical protein C9J27_22615 [Photobacterium kishitanii]PSU95662.1 hypothetical protein C0W35_06480 [Photobacterium kishitanii]CEO41641.1 exported hypothetical protein [Photobacterium kishitanii]